MERCEIINLIIDKYKYENYLEIGIGFAYNFLKIKCKNKECVDPYIVENEPDANIIVRQFIESNILTYKMTSDEFFASIPNDKMYDIIFIDGLHTEEQVGRDIINSIKHLKVGGTIVIHDCLPKSREAQLDKPVTEEWNGSTWKAIPMLRFQGINYITIDADCGCCVIQPFVNAETLYYPPKAEYDYDDVFRLQTIRNLIMNVVTEEQFKFALENKINE